MLYYRPRGSVGLTYSASMGGIVIAPDDNDLILCGYGSDGGTRAKVCSPARSLVTYQCSTCCMPSAHACMLLKLLPL